LNIDFSSQASSSEGIEIREPYDESEHSGKLILFVINIFVLVRKSEPTLKVPKEEYDVSYLELFVLTLMCLGSHEATGRVGSS
jgi:hypothetical protein